jgi:hypothetical protein
LKKNGKSEGIAEKNTNPAFHSTGAPDRDEAGAD